MHIQTLARKPAPLANPGNLAMDGVTEDDLLGLATGVEREVIVRRRVALSESERNVLGLRAPWPGPGLSEAEIGRRLGLPRRRVRHLLATAQAKLHGQTPDADPGPVSVGRITAASLGKIPTTRDRRLISLLIRSSGLVDQIFDQ